MGPNIGLIVTGKEAAKELQTFAKSLEPWHPNATLFVATDDETDIAAIKFSGKIIVKQTLNQYVGKRRNEMESLPGLKYKTMFHDYTFEKANVIEWMLDSPDVHDAWFLDADITFLAPLPKIPENTTIALSPHYIRESDTNKFGFYNAGFIWMKNKKYLEDWVKAGKTSRFYEQAALEEIAKKAKEASELYEFPIQVNFGWWRMFQAKENSSQIQSKFALFRNEQSIGLRYDGKALQSVHTHWNNQGEHALRAFNQWFRTFLEKFKNHPPIKVFSKAIL